MDLIKLKQQIQKGQLAPFYVFTGDEIALQTIYLNKMGKITRVDTVLEIWNKLINKSKLLKQTNNKIYVVRDDKDFMDKLTEDMISAIKDNILVLEVTDINKKSNFYKIVKPYIVEFNRMTTAQLLPQVLNMMPVKDKKLTQEFIEACDNDYGTIINEIDKAFYGGVQSIEEVIEDSKTYSTFTLIDKAFMRDYDTIKYAVQLLDYGESGIGILTLLHNKASELLQILNGVIPNGRNEWQCKKAMQHNKYNDKQLYRITRYTKKYIEGIKQGDYVERDAVLLCLMKINN